MLNMAVPHRMYNSPVPEIKRIFQILINTFIDSKMFVLINHSQLIIIRVHY